MKPTSHVMVLPPNSSGSDWFVGDIHGHFKRLKKALDRMGFREDVDRLISVGDLIDRGPESIEARHWLEKPWFIAARGNHDDMFLEWRDLAGAREQQEEYEQTFWFDNGGQWVQTTTEVEQQDLENELRQMPYVIIVPHADGRLVAATHANMPPQAQWPALLNTPLEQFQRAVWCRQRTRGLGEGIDGIEAVVCGHTIMPRPTWIGQFFHIETAGWHNGQFTLIKLDQILNDVRNQPLD